eukprot:TRINITY_DN13651_c0_g1_i2.p1 TRINITY_DN13651_c0_g1~~TRINITY_DN13651_c0_g1_i2.p1  ORF type:complete len:223 (-),score=54.24 TRINITY_DN13651_c0_g1_i2:346-1014(-)
MGLVTGDKTKIAKAIGAIQIEKVVGPGTEQTVAYQSFWDGQPAFIHLMRRFGCRLCRGGAMELNRAIPHLKAMGIRCIAVGLERLGVDEFVEGKFWDGGLYIDEGKKAYKALQLQSTGLLKGLMALGFNKSVKDGLRRTTEVPGDLKGDGMQLGATFAFAQGGDLLFEFRQKNFAEHPTCEQVLRAFGIDPSVLTEAVKDPVMASCAIPEEGAEGVCASIAE